ncbi:unnamed protein product [Heligmosomoides polygyrus]|uniref:Uncharacterized protein n=1 Tax=Heligmosomoides polygyrus TaxID=6339 RepID=A0A183GB24_HELPZ|nr:unnamed protein product [Heligmosomoides polygyrus]
MPGGERHHTANDKKFTTIENHEFLQPTFKYGEMQQSEATDKTANIYRFINILHKRTTVSSDRGTLARVPVRPLEAKRQDGVPIPGYVVLLIALLLVVALAILASAIMNYHKRSAAQKGVFGESPVMRTKRAKKSQRKGHHEERPRSPLEKPEGSQGNEEINKMRSEPFGDICKAVSKETWEELALVISKRRKMEDVSARLWQERTARQRYQPKANSLLINSTCSFHML